MEIKLMTPYEYVIAILPMMAAILWGGNRTANSVAEKLATQLHSELTEVREDFRESIDSLKLELSKRDDSLAKSLIETNNRLKSLTYRVIDLEHSLSKLSNGGFQPSKKFEKEE